MSKISEALEAWRQAVRQLEITKPGATDWDRARLEEEDRRAAYQTAAADARRAQREPSESSGSVGPEAAGSPGG
jgi:hypothetical protein